MWLAKLCYKTSEPDSDELELILSPSPPEIWNLTANEKQANGQRTSPENALDGIC